MSEPSQRPVRILLVDDHTLFRESLRRVLEADGGYTVVAEAGTLRAALEFSAGSDAFDLGLIDYQLSAADPAQNGLQVLRAIRAANPSAAMILLTAGAPGAPLREAVEVLHAGVCLKSEPTEEMFAAIRQTLQGTPWVSGEAAAALAQPESPTAWQEAAFTVREQWVLRWITEGLSNKQIADKLDVSESSVKALLQKLFEKTAVRTRSQLVRYVFECGLALP